MTQDITIDQMSDASTPRPWIIWEHPPGKEPGAGTRPIINIVSPSGEAELGNWMIAERVRWKGDAALIVRSVNAHDDLLLAAREAAVVIFDTAKAAGADPTKGTCLPRLLAAIAKAEGK